MHPIDTIASVLAVVVSLYVLWDIIKTIVRILLYVLSVGCLIGVVLVLWSPPASDDESFLLKRILEAQYLDVAQIRNYITYALEQI